MHVVIHKLSYVAINHVCCWEEDELIQLKQKSWNNLRIHPRKLSTFLLKFVLSWIFVISFGRVFHSLTTCGKKDKVYIWFNDTKEWFKLNVNATLANAGKQEECHNEPAFCYQWGCETFPVVQPNVWSQESSYLMSVRIWWHWHPFSSYNRFSESIFVKPFPVLELG